MSQENVEIVRRLLEAFSRQDGNAVRDLWTVDAEWRPAYFGGGLLEGTVFHGRERVVQFVALQSETWESFTVEPVELRDLDGQVLAELRLRAVGRASGILVERVTWNVFRLRDGKVAFGRAYTSQEEALKAVGLEE